MKDLARDDQRIAVDGDDVRVLAGFERAVAGREAERVRRWITQHDNDFVVRVYAVLVTPELQLPRTTTCSVVTADGLAGWLDALPRQRSFSTDRQARLAAMLGPVPLKGRRRVAA